MIRRRTGFTLVELLVVIAIIGILVALLLPAIQAAREASRRSQCGNNLKQLGLGLQNHHDVFRRLPPGGAQDQPPFGTAASGEGSGWMVYILPYIEMGSLYDQFQFTGGSGWGTAAATNNYNLVNNMPMPGYRCPSSPLPAFATGTGFNGTNPALPTYAGVAGAITGLIPGYVESRTNTGGGGSGCCTGGIVGGGGVLFPNSQTNYRDITDGTSNQFVVAEQSNFIITTDGVKNAWNAGSGDGWLIGVNTTNTIPNFNGGGDARAFNTVTIRYPVNLNGTWTPGGNCGGQGVCINVGNNIPVNSAHPGGAMVLLCDGAVRFVADGTPISTLAQLATRDDGNPVGTY